MSEEYATYAFELCKALYKDGYSLDEIETIGILITEVLCSDVLVENITGEKQEVRCD